MKNPCSDCLVKVNCTQICPDKNNFQVWLSNGIKQFGNGRHATTPQLRRQFTKIRDMQTENTMDMIDIDNRRKRVEGGQDLI